ncbi:unnamed protein product [Mytilus coruscus]|uniref:Uncharacterized protein n=1 Tax=Mytilus coruscus TaxID=42192 RepID=A0A6J8D942_MYTCO|nr:unnamed protein product [Mytilus coruscus]
MLLNVHSFLKEQIPKLSELPIRTKFLHKNAKSVIQKIAIEETIRRLRRNVENPYNTSQDKAKYILLVVFTFYFVLLITIADGGKSLEEVVVTPSHDKTFGDLYLDTDDLKKNPQKGIEPQLAGMMIDVLKASGHLDETTPVKDVKTPSLKKGIIFGLPKPMPPPPPLMSKNTSTLQHSTTVQKASYMSQTPKLTCLRVALRQIERDHAVSKETDTLKTKIKQGTSKSAITTEEPKNDKLVGMINQLTQVTLLEQQNTPQKYSPQFNRGYRGNNRGFGRGRGQPPRGTGNWQSSKRTSNWQSSRGTGNWQPPSTGNWNQQSSDIPTYEDTQHQPTQQQGYQQEPKCNRCGHLHIGCRQEDRQINWENFVENGDMKTYLRRMSKKGEWKYHVVVLGMSAVLKCNIIIITSSPNTHPDDNIIWVNFDNASVDFIILGHIWENHYQLLRLFKKTKQKQCAVLHSLGYEIAAIAAKKSEPSYGFDSPKGMKFIRGVKTQNYFREAVFFTISDVSDFSEYVQENNVSECHSYTPEREDSVSENETSIYLSSESDPVDIFTSPISSDSETGDSSVFSDNDSNGEFGATKDDLGDGPLFDGCKLSPKSSYTMLFVSRFKLPNDGFSNLLKIISSHLPVGCNYPTSINKAPQG